MEFGKPETTMSDLDLSRPPIRALREIATVFGILDFIWFGMTAWGSLTKPGLTSEDVLGGVIWGMIALTAIGFIAGGLALNRQQPWGRPLLCGCAIVGILLTAASVLPLYNGTIGYIRLENHGDHSMAWLTVVAYLIGLIIDALQIGYCATLFVYLVWGAKSRTSQANQS